MKTLRVLSLVTLTGCYSLATFAAEAPTPSQTVSTTGGKVRGLVEDGVSSFKGIPYGAPPIGQRRFLPPRPAEPWTTLLDATDFGAPAIQMYDRPVADTDLSLQLATVFTTRSDMKIDNEDCLFLNVWTPGTDSGKRPVMVWIHGGGYAYGSGAWPLYDGASLARRGDVVVVTVNHRLNVFGYLYLKDIAGERYAESGNAGMLDLVLALQWVRENIASFGGDPSNVTIMGESGGGSKVSTLLAMPAARGLFHKAVIQSGPGLTGVPVATASKATAAILKELGITADNFEDLLSLPAPTIVAAVAAAQRSSGGAFGGLRLAPVVDGVALPRDPFTPDAPALSKDVPILIGWNKDEWTIFNTSAPWFGSLTEEQLASQARTFVGEKADAVIATYHRLFPDYSPTYVFNAIMGDSRMLLGSTVLAERKAAQGGAPAYVYYLAWETPVGNGIFKTPHTLDIPFMFANVDRAVALTGDSPESRSLENQMSSSWVAFARTGNPNNPEVPDWPAYDAAQRRTMVFDAQPRVENDPKGALRTLYAAPRSSE